MVSLLGFDFNDLFYLLLSFSFLPSSLHCRPLLLFTPAKDEKGLEERKEKKSHLRMRDFLSLENGPLQLGLSLFSFFLLLLPSLPPSLSL